MRQIRLATAIALVAAAAAPQTMQARPGAEPRAGATPTYAATASPKSDAGRARALAAASPLAFERNVGQAPADAAFVARAPGRRALVSASGASVTDDGVTLALRVAGASADTAGEGLDPLASATNYLTGPASDWKSGIANFGRVRFDDAARGLAVEYSGARGALEITFDAAAGVTEIPLAADAARVARVEGGDLLLDVPGGRARLSRPEAVDAAGRPVMARFVAAEGGFHIAIEASRSTDHTVTTAVSLKAADAPASGEDEGWSVVTDASGNIYVAGATESALFPSVNGVQQAIATPFDGFVTKMSPSGQVLFSTFLGGNDGDGVHAITLDGSGNIVVAGATASTNFPVVGGLQGQNNSICDFFTGCFDAFVTKISADGRTILYSTYLGGENDDEVNAVKVDAATGDIIIAGSTNSETFPTVNAIDSTWGGGFCGISACPDAFVARIAAPGSSLVYSTYHGGFGYDIGQDLGVDAAGNAVVVGWTASDEYPLANPIQRSLLGELDAFAAKITPTGSALVYSTYIGGRGTDGANGVVVDGGGNALLAGFSYSLDYPTQNAFQAGNGGIYTSQNAGSAWSQINNGLTISPVFFSVGVDPTNPLVAYAGSEINGIFKTTDGGASWQQVQRFFAGLPVRAITVDPHNPSVVYAGTSEGLWRSADGGGTWARLENGIPTETIDTIVVDPTNSNTVYVLGAITGLYKSTDGGASFALKTSAASFALTIHPKQTSTVLATGFARVLRSDDAGETWTTFEGNGLPVTSLYGIAVDPTDSQVLYVGTIGNGIYKSTDGGTSWFQTDATVTSGIITTMKIDPANPSTLYVGMEGDRAFTFGKDGKAAAPAANASSLFPIDAKRYSTGLGGERAGASGAAKAQVNTNGGVFKSTDGGFTWTPVNTGLTSNRVLDLALAGSDSSRLYAASYQAGDVVLTKLDPSGQLVSSTFFGASDEDVATSVTLDGSGNIYFGGYTWSIDFNTVNPAQPAKGSQLWADGFVAKMNASATALLGATFLGGDEDEYVNDVAVDSSGAPVATGLSISANYPLASAHQPIFGDGGSDGIVTKLAPSFGSFVFSTYLGGWSAKPFIDDALTSNGHFAVTGSFFDIGATVYINGQRQITRNWPADPSGTLVVAKPGTKLLIGRTYRIQVRNANGTWSDPFFWTVPDPNA